MRAKALFSIGGAIVTAGISAIGLAFNAFDVYPTIEWKWIALIGFVVFVIFVFWIVWDKQKRIDDLESGKPQITLGKMETVVQIKQNGMIEDNIIFLRFKNTGTKPAYQYYLRVGYAPEEKPQEFKLFSENTSANPFFPADPEYFVQHKFTRNYEIKNGIRTTETPNGVLIHCTIKYSDAPCKGKLYNDEWWLSYLFEPQLISSLSIARKKLLEPYVRAEYSKLE